MFRQIVEKEPIMKKEFSSDARDILKRLLDSKAAKRLGSGPDGTDEIKKHPFFKSVDWIKLYNKEIEPPYKPVIQEGEDD